jgi:hypothetical protein
MKKEFINRAICPGYAGKTAKTRAQLADEYRVSTKTLSRWLKNAGLEIPSGLICPSDQEKIYKKFGCPI